MPNFKTCVNGHNYDADKNATCPFCPVNDENTDYEKTMMDFKKTQVFDEGNSNRFDKTMINEETRNFKTTQTGAPTQPFNRTNIAAEDAGGASSNSQSEKRKLVGWLVTYSNNDCGEDYKLYAGKNKVGSAAGCDVIIKDSSVSGDHTMILFRDNEFMIKDNFSTNGTKINGVIQDEGKLKDGDEIKLGNTSLKFKTAF